MDSRHRYFSRRFRRLRRNAVGRATEEEVPIAVLEEQKRIAEKKVEDEEKTNEMVDQLTTGPTTMSDEKHEKPNIDDVLKEENNVTEMNGVQDSDLSILDLGLGLNSPNDNLDDIETKESQTEKTSSSTLLSMDEAA
uniref:Uncharacterized protein n=1 Tax=Cannabis sativa TaxID=3483 RepID=A0A803QCF9_CANSA